MPFLKMSFPVLCTAPQDGHGRSCAARPNAFESSAVDLTVGVTDAAVEQHAVRRGGIEQFKHFAICCVCSSFLGKILQNEFNGTSAVRTGVRAGTDIMPELGTVD